MASKNRSYEYLEKGKKEARIGLDSEKDIVKMINENINFRKEMLNCLKHLGFKINDNIIASNEGGNKKSDIILSNGCKVGISIKSTTRTSFHQLDRRTLDKWKNYLEMPDDIYRILRESILRVANDQRDPFIIKEDQKKIKSFFLENLESILREIFTKNEEHLKLFMVNDKREETRRIYVFRMEEVLNFLMQDGSDVSFTKKGIITLGKFIKVQRKGGNGNRIKIPKTDWKHPGNNLQFKFSPLDFTAYIEDTNEIRFCRINY
ncbi:MAG: hypothetical protein AB7E45_06135 [Candidatus Caldatribacteriota bacterium]